jgi:hypothetical protein
MSKPDFDYAGDIRGHLRLNEQVFKTIALAIDQARLPQGHSEAKRVCTNLLTQIGQDNPAVSLLVSSGFPYQAITVATSSFEHAVMVASISDNEARARTWLRHADPSRNIHNMKTSLEQALDNL